MLQCVPIYPSSQPLRHTPLIGSQVVLFLQLSLQVALQFIPKNPYEHSIITNSVYMCGLSKLIILQKKHAWVLLTQIIHIVYWDQFLFATLFREFPDINWLAAIIFGDKALFITMFNIHWQRRVRWRIIREDALANLANISCMLIKFVYSN